MVSRAWPHDCLNTDEITLGIRVVVHIVIVSASTEISIYRIVSSLTQADSGYFPTFLTISASLAKCKRYHKLMMDWTFPAQWREHNYENRQKYKINHVGPVIPRICVLTGTGANVVKIIFMVNTKSRICVALSAEGFVVFYVTLFHLHR